MGTASLEKERGYLRRIMDDLVATLRDTDRVWPLPHKGATPPYQPRAASPPPPGLIDLTC